MLNPPSQAILARPPIWSSPLKMKKPPTPHQIFFENQNVLCHSLWGRTPCIGYESINFYL